MSYGTGIDQHRMTFLLLRRSVIVRPVVVSRSQTLIRKVCESLAPRDYGRWARFSHEKRSARLSGRKGSPDTTMVCRKSLISHYLAVKSKYSVNLD